MGQGDENLDQDVILKFIQVTKQILVVHVLPELFTNNFIVHSAFVIVQTELDLELT